MTTHTAPAPASSAAQHTPGPWIQQTNEAGTQIRITDSATEGRCVSTVRVFGDAGNTRANARLIAAAPDLLAALEESLEVIRLMGCDMSNFTQARAAIARAKGQV